MKLRYIPVPDGPCYLCGEKLSHPINGDHVPPKQLYAPAVRRQYNISDMLKVHVHEHCNKRYQRDEDYFVASLMPFSKGTPAGEPLWQHKLQKYKDGEGRGLFHAVLGEFERKPGGVILPHGKVAKRFDSTRFRRVISKLIKGLYFHHENRLLPAEWKMLVDVTAQRETPPEHFIIANSQPGAVSRGRHPAVFDYKYLTLSTDDPPGENIQYWMFLFWDAVIVTAAFIDQTDSKGEPELSQFEEIEIEP